MHDVPFIVEVNCLVRLVWSILINIQQVSMLTIEIRRTLTARAARMPRQNMVPQFQLEAIAP